MAGFADNYVSVNERIELFLTMYKDGRIQTEIAHLSDNLVVMKAYAYRSADDDKPSIAHSQLVIPGSTNFTRGSEVENAETSAVGRALAFMGFETKRGIASREEVQSRQHDRDPEPRRAMVPARTSGPTDFIQDFWKWTRDNNWERAEVLAVAGTETLAGYNEDDIIDLKDNLTGRRATA